MKLVLKFLSPLQSCWEWRFLVLGYILGGPLRVHSECFLDVPAGHHPASAGTRSPLPRSHPPGFGRQKGPGGQALREAGAATPSLHEGGPRRSVGVGGGAPQLADRFSLGQNVFRKVVVLEKPPRCQDTGLPSRRHRHSEGQLEDTGLWDFCFLLFFPL